MIIENSITKGMVQDVDPRNQPKGTWSDSRNGTITQQGKIYVWKPVKVTELAFSLSTGEQLMDYCNIRSRYFANNKKQKKQVVNLWGLFFKE